MRSRIISAAVGAATGLAATGEFVAVEPTGGAVCPSAITIPDVTSAAQAKNLLTFSGILCLLCNSFLTAISIDLKIAR
jgi:hypothetical protein